MSGKEKKEPSERHSLSKDGMRRDLSDHQNKAAKQETLTSWRTGGQKHIRKRNKSDRVRGTHILKVAETCFVRTRKESESVRGTHILEAMKGESH